MVPWQQTPDFRLSPPYILWGNGIVGCRCRYSGENSPVVGSFAAISPSHTWTQRSQHTLTNTEWGDILVSCRQFCDSDDLLFKHTHMGHVVGVLQVWVHRILIAHRCSTVDSLLVSPLSLLCCITPFLFPHVSVIPSSPAFACLTCLTPLLSVLFSSLFSPSLVCLSH